MSSANTKTFLEKLRAIGTSPLGHGLIGGAAVGGVAPYAILRRGDDEDEEVFNARRRGIAAAGAVAGGVLGSRIVPHLTVDRFSEKRASVVKEIKRGADGFLGGYFARQRAEGEAAERDMLKAQYEGMSAQERRAQQEEFDKRREEAERRKKLGFQPRPILSRAAETAAGGALIAKNVPQIPFARGRSLLFHGTGAGGVQGIMRDDGGGLDVRYAGTKGRLNAVLVPNALTKTLLENGAGVHLQDTDVARIQNDIVNRLKAARGEPVIESINAALNSLAEKRPELSEIIEKTRTEMPNALSNAGVRIYFANSPHNVMTWSDDSNELQKIMNQAMDKAKDSATKPKVGVTGQMMGNVGRDVLDFVTGGATDVGRQYVNAADYQKSLQFHPDKLTPAQVQELASRAPVGTAFAFGVDVPTRDVKMLADFKGVAPFLRLSPRLQGLLGKMPGFEGYDPNNDISTARNVGRENIKFIDIQHPNEAPKRHFLTSYSPEKLSIGDRLRGVRSAALPLALTGLGANMIYRGVSGRPGAIQDTITAAKKRYIDGQTPDETKTAAAPTSGNYGKFRPTLNTAKLVGKYGLPAMAVGTGIAAIDQAIGDKIMPVKDYEIEPLTAEEEARGVQRDFVRGMQGTALRAGAALGLTALGAKVGSNIARKKLQQMFPDLEAALKAAPNDQGLLALKNMLDKGGSRAGALAGTQLPGLAAIGGAMTSRALNAARRGDDPLREQLGETRQEIAATPWKSAIAPAVGTLVGGTYAGSRVAKNFPGMLASLRRKVMFEGVDPIAAVTGRSSGAKIYPGQLVPESYSKLLEDLADDPSAAFTLNELRAIQSARRGDSTHAAKGVMGAMSALSELDPKRLMASGFLKDEAAIKEMVDAVDEKARGAYATAEKLFSGHDERQRAAAEKIMRQSGLERAYVEPHLHAALEGSVFVPKNYSGLYTRHGYVSPWHGPEARLGAGPTGYSKNDDAHDIYDLYEHLKGTGHFSLHDLQKRFRLAGEARAKSVAQDRATTLARYPDNKELPDPVSDALLHIGSGAYTPGQARAQLPAREMAIDPRLRGPDALERAAEMVRQEKTVPHPAREAELQRLRQEEQELLRRSEEARDAWLRGHSDEEPATYALYATAAEKHRVAQRKLWDLEGIESDVYKGIPYQFEHDVRYNAQGQRRRQAGSPAI